MLLPLHADRHLLLNFVYPRMRGASRDRGAVDLVLGYSRMAFVVSDDSGQDVPHEVHPCPWLRTAVRGSRFTVGHVDVNAPRKVGHLNPVDGRYVLGHIAIHDVVAVENRAWAEGPRGAFGEAGSSPGVGG